MNVIMLGAPGSGKGTQAERITEKYNIPHISTGDIFRENIKNGTELGKQAKAYMDKGELVPDEFVCDLVLDRIHQADCANGYVLDGFPRTLPQADIFDKALKDAGEKIDVAIFMNLSNEYLVQRMEGRRVCPKCGAGYHTTNMPPKVQGICDECGSELIQRKDDNIETFKNRLEVYDKETAPLVPHYEAQGIVVTIDGKKGLEPCWQDIVTALTKFE
ncbi:MAG: adenylate kinase [Lachnospiraceae bacterium]|nr:adenylate kinase [Lachnospiraceae bacterium]